MTSLQNGNYNSRSMNGLTQIYANDINCDVINTIDANVSNKLKVVNECEIDGTLSVAGVTTAAQINATGLNVSGNADVLGSLDVSGNVDISGNLSVVGITDTTRLQADNLILGGATYNAGIQIKADGIMLLGNRANTNVVPRVLNVAGDNALIDISRYSNAQAGFQLRNYDPVTEVRRGEALFLGPSSTGDSWTWLFRTGSDFFGGSGTRTLFQFNTPLYVIPSNPASPVTGTAYTARYRDATTTNNVDIVLNPNANDFSTIVQAGDAVILNSTSGRTLTLTTNNASGCGIRMNSTISVGGNTTFANLIIANNGIAIASAGISTSIFKSSTDLRIDGDQANSRVVIRNRDSGGTSYASCVLSTTENRWYGGEFSFRNTTAVTGDAYFRMTTDTNNIFIEPRAIGSNVLKNLRFITPGGTTAHLGIDSVDGSVVIATNTPATGCKLTVNGKAQITNLDVSGALTSGSFSPTNINWADGTTQDSKFIENSTNDMAFHKVIFPSRNAAYSSTFNIQETDVSYFTLSTGIHYFAAIQVIKGQTINYIGVYVDGVVGSSNLEVALYDNGLQPARLALASGGMGGIGTGKVLVAYLTSSYTATATKFIYVAFRTTTATTQVLCKNANDQLNYGVTTTTNSTLNRRVMSYANVNTFPANIAAGQVMTIVNRLPYVCLLQD